MLTDEIMSHLAPMLYKECCKVRVHYSDSLTIGFGEKIYHNCERLVDPFFAEWEIRTDWCAWRIRKGNHVICGKDQLVETFEELHEIANKIVYGTLISISQPSDIDLRLEFDTGIVIEFFASLGFNDSYYEIFCPNDIVIVLLSRGNWIIERTNIPQENSEGRI